ncbi:hypothetical protein N9O24_00520, partial [bacterium]|nr:hypothetical protein [bacterium]
AYVGAYADTAFVYMAANSAVATSTFGAEQIIYWRECSIGLRTDAYFWAKVLADVPKCFASALSAFYGVRPYFETPLETEDMILGMVMLYAFAYASGYLVSFLVPYGKSSLACVCCSMVFGSIFGGIFIKMSEGAPPSARVSNAKKLI